VTVGRTMVVAARNVAGRPSGSVRWGGRSVRITATPVGEVPVARVRVHAISLSLDGYMAGPDQDLEHPIGVDGLRLHEWVFATRTFRRIHGAPGGETGVDDDVVSAGFAGIGATIMGRNMFGPVRGPWEGSDWAGWWGDTPPFGHPVFVLTHFPRADPTMPGGTTFHFVTDGIDMALARARDAAAGADVRVGGGAATIRECLRTALIDEMHVAVVPVLLGRGERLFTRLGDLPSGYRCELQAVTAAAAHFRAIQTAEHGRTVPGASEPD
jgi:dihydrofolate reductase